MCVLKLIPFFFLNLKKHTCCLKQGVFELRKPEGFFSMLSIFLDCIITHTYQTSFGGRDFSATNFKVIAELTYVLAPGNWVARRLQVHPGGRRFQSIPFRLMADGKWLFCGAQGAPWAEPFYLGVGMQWRWSQRNY